MSKRVARRKAREPSSTDWLAKPLNAPNLRIIAARASLRDYLQGHIPTAISLNTAPLRISQGGVPARLLPPERLAEIFGASGIGTPTPSSFTPAPKTLSPMRLTSPSSWNFCAGWLLSWHLRRSDSGAIKGCLLCLAGGFEKWQAEGLPVVREFPQVRPTRFVPSRLGNRTSPKLKGSMSTGFKIG